MSPKKRKELEAFQSILTSAYFTFKKKGVPKCHNRADLVVVLRDLKTSIQDKAIRAGLAHWLSTPQGVEGLAKIDSLVKVITFDAPSSPKPATAPEPEPRKFRLLPGFKTSRGPKPPPTPPPQKS